ncbi:hypothetical protein EC957_006071 [Mortierella hygrophila]|uniref:Uncharacterized protein n=1 Tax=Mortierella hygrophila TaxID=979708 RepID=A0A9P6JYS1_9FUNG|nr:hypothetical protein EC957_006071 [Mortierella hygrophila]
MTTVDVPTALPPAMPPATPRALGQAPIALGKLPDYHATVKTLKKNGVHPSVPTLLHNDDYEDTPLTTMLEHAFLGSNGLGKDFLRILGEVIKNKIQEKFDEQTDNKSRIEVGPIDYNTFNKYIIKKKPTYGNFSVFLDQYDRSEGGEIHAGGLSIGELVALDNKPSRITSLFFNNGNINVEGQGIFDGQAYTGHWGYKDWVPFLKVLEGTYRLISIDGDILELKAPNTLKSKIACRDVEFVEEIAQHCAAGTLVWIQVISMYGQSMVNSYII